MGPIQSILIYNGGSAGDFLKSVSIEQLGQGSIHTLTNKGMIKFDHHYFKFITAQWYSDNYCAPVVVDNSKVYKVENTHYYHESYFKITDTIFYIDYPDNLQPLILDLYVKKRWNNNPQKLLEQHKQSLPEKLQKFVQVENLPKVLNVMWIKNLKVWRSLPQVQRIDFRDLLNYDSMALVVGKIIQQPIVDVKLLQKSYKQWIAKNHDLVNFFRTANVII